MVAKGKRKRLIALGILGIVVAAVVFLFHWQGNNLRALRYMLQMKPDNLETRLEENESSLSEALQTAGVVGQIASQNLAPSTEDLESISDGAVSAEEVARRLLEAQSTAAPSGTGELGGTGEPGKEEISQPNGSSAGTPGTSGMTGTGTGGGTGTGNGIGTDNTPSGNGTGTGNGTNGTASGTGVGTGNGTGSGASGVGGGSTSSSVSGGGTVLGGAAVQSGKTEQEKQVDQELSVQVATMYVLRASFVSRLKAIVNGAYQDYKELPADQHTTDKRWEIAYSHMDELSALEKQCDQQVQAVVGKVRSLLSESGRDLALADQIQETYEEEKSLQKAYYIAKLNG